MAKQFLDTNILLRHFLQDLPDQSARATDFMRRIENGELQTYTSDIVVFETVFTLQRQYRQPRDKIRDGVLAVLDLPGIMLAGKRRYRRVFDLYVNSNLSFADAYHVVLMDRLHIEEIVSFDRGFDRVRDIKRVEP